MTLALTAVNGLSQQAGTDSKGRPTISAGEQALAMLEVQNVFSKHAYYHQVGQFCEEMTDLWVKEDGAYAATTKWTNGTLVQEPYSMIKENYCTGHYTAMQKTLAELSKKVPSVKNVPENITAGTEYVMHTQETPVIEVAGDGKTAKGMWYSIGQGVRGSISEDGKATKTTEWMWEKYAVDFVKEDGKWKMWHLVNMMDQPPVVGTVEVGGSKGGPGGPGAGQAQAGDKKGATPKGAEVGTGAGGARLKSARTVEIFDWNPTVPLKMYPKFPEPYYTFSETFSY